MFGSVEALHDALKGILNIEGEDVKVLDENRFKSEALRELALNSAINDKIEVVKEARRIIRKIASDRGIKTASIHDYYMSVPHDDTVNFTVPAINLRMMTYDSSRAVFRSAKKVNAGLLIFEIARSEIGYTKQSPDEYVSSLLAAAIREDYPGPIFVQGDHFQVKAKKFFGEERDTEIDSIKKLIDQAIDAGFYNIDIDSSTLVELDKATIKEQQYHNYKICADLTRYIREKQPAGINISVGGEIGEIGKGNTTEEELRAFMEGYLEELGDMPSISKISIQTGTAHGGVVLPDGSIAKVKIDFDTLKRLGEVARKEYKIGGVVQHGASTLPDEAFHHFPDNRTLEVHLATGFQNIMFDHPKFPKDLYEKMVKTIFEKYGSERKDGMTDEQFIYKTRKKMNGDYKKELWMLDTDIREAIEEAWEKKFDFLFEQLRIKDNRKYLDKYIKI
ncbi:MAG TPA: aldolase [Firmicutes bacterium]|uniref:Aldolase n=1 Tax=candidate division TA06 bacterium TaxID=2250710 RepID=A0A660S6G8_UNCT6|nr:MAG: aldolase [candidate division TA06 bacterium]HFD04661.1 aldolase [Bacillota bacterium]